MMQLLLATQAWADRLLLPRLTSLQLRRITTCVAAFIAEQPTSVSSSPSTPASSCAPLLNARQPGADLCPVEFYESSEEPYGILCNFYPSAILWTV